MFDLEGIGLTVEAEALRAVARKAIARGTGARGLRAVLEETMLDVMFDIPSRDDVREVVLTAESVEGRVPPLLVLDPDVAKKEA
jgi:ATP-dependent Clp protease ATP-binding subunit ClpX